MRAGEPTYRKRSALLDYLAAHDRPLERRNTTAPRRQIEIQGNPVFPTRDIRPKVVRPPVIRSRRYPF